MHRAPDGISRNPANRDSLVLARAREWELHRANIKGVMTAVDEEDEELPLDPVEQPEPDEPYDEDLVDNWKRSTEPCRWLDRLWTGFTDCERPDGQWIREDHTNPRHELYVPEGGSWTGRRRTSVRYEEGLVDGGQVPTSVPAAGYCPVPEALSALSLSLIHI